MNGKGHQMADSGLGNPNLLSYLLGIVQVLWLILLGRTNSKADSSLEKVDKERTANEARFNLVYEKIAKQENTIHTCKNQIEEDMKHHMTEGQIKDFVDRSIKPIETSIKAVHEDVKEILKERRPK